MVLRKYCGPLRVVFERGDTLISLETDVSLNFFQLFCLKYFLVCFVRCFVRCLGPLQQIDRHSRLWHILTNSIAGISCWMEVYCFPALSLSSEHKKRFKPTNYIVLNHTLFKTKICKYGHWWFFHLLHFYSGVEEKPKLRIWKKASWTHVWTNTRVRVFPVFLHHLPVIFILFIHVHHWVFIWITESVCDLWK